MKALMEYHCSKEKDIAFKIFDIGLKSFSEEPRFVLEYLQFLINIDDDQSITFIDLFTFRFKGYF